MTVSDFIDDPTLRIAGRLDMDSEGLVFLTDHGGLNQFITNPANKKYKTYLVQVDGDVTVILLYVTVPTFQPLGLKFLFVKVVTAKFAA